VTKFNTFPRVKMMVCCWWKSILGFSSSLPF
jgi:hypothetical protein